MTDRDGFDRSDEIDWDATMEARSKEIGVLLFKNASMHRTLVQVHGILETDDAARADLALQVIQTLMQEPWMQADQDG